MDMSLSKLWEMVMDRVAWCAAVYEVTKNWTRLSTELNWLIINAFPHLHSFKNQHFSRERRMRGIEIENENELWWVRHSLCSVFTTVPISLTEMLRKWVLPWKNYILSRPAAVTGLSQNTRDAASESCALEIPAFLWSGFSSAKKKERQQLWK